MNKEFYTTDEIGELLGINRATVRRYLDREQIPTLKLDGGWRVPPESVAMLLKALYKDQGNE